MNAFRSIRLALVAALVLSAATARAESDTQRMQGAWRVTSDKQSGEETRQAVDDVFTFSGNECVIKTKAGNEIKGQFQLDEKQKPRQVDVTIEIEGQKMVMQAVYEIKGDKLVCCLARPGDGRPGDLKTKKGDHRRLITLERVQVAKKRGKKPPKK